MANITHCKKCGGTRFVYDVVIGGGQRSVPMRKYLKGTTYVNMGEDHSCKCDQ